ncbi:MAG: O-antigen ligase family protein [Parasporobacterium sp.]|nr:O-antigen ligase family protein [Parasporobacterium sp.]
MILLIVALFFIQTPYFFSVIPAISSITFYVRFVVFLILAICIVVLHRDIRSFFRDELLLWGCAGWGITLCISMIINDKTLGYACKELILPSLVVLMLFSVFSQVNVRKFLLVLFLYYLTMNTLNNASVLFFHNTGIWLWNYAESSPEYVFFSHVNGGITCGLNSILPGLIYSWYYDRRWNKVNIINIVYSLYGAIIAECVVQIVAYIVAGILIIICYLTECSPGFQKLLKWINLKTIMIFNLLVFDAVIVLGNTGWMELIGIDPRVHGRRELWDQVLTSFIDHPIIGQGFISWFGVEIYGKTYYLWHQHSIYLQILYETGLIGAAIFVFIFGVSIHSLGKLKNFSVRFITGVLTGVFFLSMVVDTCERTEIFLLLAICYYIPMYLQRRNDAIQT